mgnify:CR=1 FL=1
MTLFTEETFGPVLPITTFDTVDEAIELANATEYGLGVSIFTKDLKQAKSFGDLTVDQNFEFTNSNKLTLDIEIASLTNTAAYVSVCQVESKTSKATG